VKNNKTAYLSAFDRLRELVESIWLLITQKNRIIMQVSGDHLEVACAHFQ
jgi:hypothetical protein